MHTDTNGMLVLDEAACRALLHSTRLGRIALTDRALPMILPVTFACLDRDILFRAGPGTLDRAAEAEQVVCFETDWADEHGHAAWSVAAIGRLARVRDPWMVEACRQVDLPSWSDGPTRESSDYITLSPQVITGRRRAG
jgi:nitroimidazol reductase NimA-like FMN-containing flavoprotein (pyridoxamine 5'-phosphate oxidase superfamily)